MFGSKHNIQKDLAELRQQIVENSLELQAVTQDILACKGPRSDLEQLNEAGRAKISALRKCIERLDDYSSDLSDPQIYKEVNLHRESFSKSLQAFRKANIQTMLEIEKVDRVDLLTSVSSTLTGTDKDGTRHRSSAGVTASGSGLAKKAGVVSQHESVTEKMLSISRHLSETTQKSAATLETLVGSSVSVEGTHEELFNTAGTIQQSGKLLKKYGRRECTDKILLFFAFAFFIACVIYIVQKRLF